MIQCGKQANLSLESSSAHKNSLLPIRLKLFQDSRRIFKDPLIIIKLLRFDA